MKDHNLKCAKHTDRDAVAQCDECGAEICAQCAEATAILRDECGTLCMGCFSKKAGETLDYWKEKRKPRLTRLIVSIVLYVIGLILLIMGIAKFGFLFILLGIILCGIYTGLTWRKGANEKRKKKEHAAGLTRLFTKEKPEKQESVWKKILFFLLGIILGVFITPVRIVIDAIALSKDQRIINQIKQQLWRAKSASK